MWLRNALRDPLQVGRLSLTGLLFLSSVSCSSDRPEFGKPNLSVDPNAAGADVDGGEAQDEPGSLVNGGGGSGGSNNTAESSGRAGEDNSGGTGGDNSDDNSAGESNSAAGGSGAPGGSVPECVEGAKRSCAMALGKAGTCGLDPAICVSGHWEGCADSIGPDTCEPGNDDDCNGSPNDGCACVNGDSGTCGEVLGAEGPCADGITTCANGLWGACDRSAATVNKCEFGNDDRCTGNKVGTGGQLPPAPCECDAEASLCFTTRFLIIDESVYDTSTRLTWQRDVSPDVYSWNGAVDHCAALPSSGLGFRLPTLDELVNIVDDNHSDPSIDPVAFPNTPVAAYWTSTLLDMYPSNAWYVGFYSGGTGYDDRSIPYQVRCVRDASP